MWKYTKVDLKLGIKSCDKKYLRGQNLQEIFIESKYKIQDIYLVRPTLPFYNLRVFVESKTYLTLSAVEAEMMGLIDAIDFLHNFHHKSITIETNNSSIVKVVRCRRYPRAYRGHRPYPKRYAAILILCS
jgi:hypothetical protein